ncbi:MAG: cytochrome b6 [Deltaproteobacteria bacterium]|nr:MAG: cytochrome b6 [Deltaproteobacteria bacterium]
MSLIGFLYGALDDRLDFDEALAQQLKKPAPHYRTKLETNLLACLGGMSFVLILVQILTGVLLLFYYRPTVSEAYQSVMEITGQVPFGWLIRGMHAWGASLLIVMVFLHMLRVFLTGAYKPPRELTWVSGVVLLALTLGFGFSGYLLPWNQLSYWATTVGTEGVSAIPLVGETLKYLIRGGHDVGQLALTRFFAMHVVILPGITMLFLTVHFLMIRRLGIADPL